MDKRKQPQTEEHRKKISLALMGKTGTNGSFKKGHIGFKAQLGKPHSEEVRKKMSSAKLGRGGELSNAWKGGVSPINNRIRKNLESRIWIHSVFSRDNWTCQKTGIRGGKLTAHHIQNFSSHPELRFAIDNGITLSEKAHKEFHKKYGKKNNTREQLLEFLT